MRKFIGSRIIKTGVAIFITALICEWLNWPPVFAVITAIVTIEPSVAQSIKKGIIRFPASAIGSFYAVLFIYFFGHSPITYTLAAVFTIFTTYRLKLYSGLLVATLTAVAMVEVIHTNVLMSFFIRLGTTTVGLIVSTLVNLLILPPDYTNTIHQKLYNIAQQTAKAIEQTFITYILNHSNKNDCQIKIDEISDSLHGVEELIQFQKDESKYHPLTVTEKENFKHVQVQLKRLKLMIYHLENVLNTPVNSIQISPDLRNNMLVFINQLTTTLSQKQSFDKSEHHQTLSQLMKLYWDDQDHYRNNNHYPTFFPSEIIILYELASIFYIVENYIKNDT